MWKRFANMLRCPLCAGALTLTEFDAQDASIDPAQLDVARCRGLDGPEFAHWVESGLVSCATCALAFPIFKGVPVLLPYETSLHTAFAAEFEQKLTTAHAHPFARREPVDGERFVLSSFSTEWLAYDFDGVIWEMDYADHERRFLAELGGHRPAAGRHGTFLELGCGIGITTHLAQRNFGVDAVGVDLSLAVLPATARYKDNPFLHFVQGSVFYLPFSPGSFDTVYSRGVLHHTYDTAAAFRALARHARTGGATYLWVYGPKSTDDNAFRRGVFVLEKIVRKLLRGRDSGWLADALLWPLAGAYVVFNRCRRLADPTIQPYNFRRALHAARDRFTPEFAHRHSAAEVVGWFRECGYPDPEVVDWHAMPSADHDDYRRNTGVRGRKTAAATATTTRTSGGREARAGSTA
jgi:SAM-dependent methyltransferase/uncharacterized protein YbaR (Trm112 family)